MGCCAAMIGVGMVVGGPVITPFASVGNWTWLKNVFQISHAGAARFTPQLFTLGSSLLLDPYQARSAMPWLPPDALHENELTTSPVEPSPSLTCTGVVQVSHLSVVSPGPRAGVAVTNTWSWSGLLLPI